MDTATTEIPTAGPGEAARDHNLPDDIKMLVIDQPGLPLTDADTRARLLAQLEREAGEFKGDVSTEAGRKEIARKGRELASLRTRIDEAGKRMTEEWRLKTAEVNAERNAVKAALTAFQDRIEAPLDAWKQAEAERSAKCDRILDRIKQSTVGLIGKDSASIKAIITDVEAITFDPAIFTEGTMAAEDAKDAALRDLRIAHTQAHEREERDRELEQLRQQQREREEADRRAAAQADAERRQREAAEAAAAAAARKAEEQAQSEARARIAAAEAEAEQERQKARDLEAARQREIDEAEQRQRDQQHRARIHAEAKGGLIAAGLTEKRAGELVLVIAAGSIPHVSIQY